MADIDRIWEIVLERTVGVAHSIHGPDHWARVERNGLYLAEQCGADPAIVRLFAVFHDAARVNEGFDPGHGGRGADLARSMASELSFLSEPDLERLYFACTWHTERTHHEDVTVGACWDADRLDLGRVGIRPRADHLNTDAARQIASSGNLELLETTTARNAHGAHSVSRTRSGLPAARSGASRGP